MFDAVRPAVVRWAAPWILIAVCLGAYCNSLEGEFIFDDTASIAENTSIRRLWPLGPVLATSPNTTSQGRPLLNLSLALNYAFSGTDVRGYHATNVAIHAAAALALWGFARRTLALPSMTDSLQPGWGGHSCPPPGPPSEAEAQRRRADGLGLAIALLWAVHPLQTESVTYVIQRAESLAGLLYLLVLYALVRGATTQDGRWAAAWYAASAVACLLGMAAKEVVVSAPVIALIYDRVFLSRSWREVWSRRKWLYAALFATWLLLAYLVVEAGGRSGTAGLGLGMSAWDYFRTQWWAIVHYLGLSLWPAELVLDYGTELAPASAAVYLCGLLLVVLGVATLAAYGRWPKWAWLGTTFFALLAPSSSFVPVLTQTVAEHRMYLPLASVVAAAVLAADGLWRRRLAARLAAWPAARYLPMAVVALAALALAMRTYARNDDYRTALGIWSDTAQKQPTNPRAHYNIGIAAAAIGEYALAETALTRTLALSDDYVDALANRGNARFQLGRFDEALVDLDRAVERHPENAKALNTRGAVHQRLGQPERAVADFTRAIALDASFAEAYSNRANCYASLGRYEEAEDDLTRAIRLKHDFAEAYNNRAIIHTALGRAPQAIEDYSRAIALAPGFVEARFNRGLAYSQIGSHAQAAADFTAAIAIRPTLGQAYLARAAAYGQLGRFDLARSDVDAAQRLGEAPTAELLRQLGISRGAAP